MSRTLVVNNTSFDYPEAGEDPGWGEAATGWAEAVTEVLGTLVAPGDILQTTSSLANNVSSLTNVSGLLFDPAIVRAVNVTYNIYRISDTNPSGNIENGVIYLNYDNNASAGNKWLLSQQINGNSGVTFNITDLGQVQYKSTDIGSTNYSGIMVFGARTLNQ